MIPIGTTQTLSIGSLSLTLTAEDFDGSQYGGLGYQRFKDVAQQMTAGESFYGASYFEGPFFAARYQFAWGLQLLPDKLYPLIALWEEQQHRIKAQQADTAIRLLDQRLVLMERNPRTRAKVGTFTGTPPTGFNFFWPQFDVILEVGSDLLEWYSRPSEDLFKVKLAARELALVEVTEDV